jgi:membrane glycosyltransferase
MLERTSSAAVGTADPGITARRAVVAALNAATMAGLLWLAAAALSPGGYGFLDCMLLGLFAVTLPWTVVGFWNAMIGLWIMQFTRDPIALVFPAAARVTGDEAVTASIAILVCIRNETPDRVLRNLEPMLSGLVEAKMADRFHVYVLSDTSDPAIAAAEEERFGALTRKWQSGIGLTYRRRARNTGFKAGNIRDFCDRWGGRHDFAVTLDADSFMTTQGILQLVRIMQADPALGILQSLVIGMPSTSAFARIFQFGMRLGMRSYTIGSAWWQGDCGPYWGHNAILRLAPFMAHCTLPVLPARGVLGGHVLSHDQIEAVLMRRAGYQVRVLPDERLGWEENPPTLIEFIRRDLRWCQGNLQYWRFLFLPGLKPVSRFQLAIALLMFLGSPAWILLLLLGSAAVARSGDPAAVLRADFGWMLLLSLLAMWFAPKIATAIDVLARPELRRAFGGTARFAAGLLIETAFFLLLSPILWFCHSLFLTGLVFGRTTGWTGQTRDDHSVPVGLAWRKLWPATVTGLATLGVLAATVPAAIPYACLIAAGLALAIPFAVLTASPAFGRTLVRRQLVRLPEETDPPPALRALALPALDPAQVPARPGTTMLAGMRGARGVVRSLRIYYGGYYGGRRRRTAMDRLYRRFIEPGDLVFDIGAHVGDRIAAFRRLGARVVAVEPQPLLVKTLKLLYGRDRSVVIEPAAVGRELGELVLKINLDNPTVSTASDAFIRAAQRAPGWQHEQWIDRIAVPMTTLDALIARHGMPAFIKIDVEGYEAEALAGLMGPVAALSFEFTTIQREIALACLERCGALGYARFNAAIGEEQIFAFAEWRSRDEIAAWIRALPPAANSGDIYAAMG